MDTKKLEQLAAVGKNQEGKTGLSPILILTAIFSDVQLVAELFRAVHWGDTPIVPTIRGKSNWTRLVWRVSAPLQMQGL